MYAIIECGGRQYRAERGHVFSVEKLPYEVGEQIELDNVLMLADGDDISIGLPTVSGASVLATIVDQYRGKKVFVFKYKPKKRYRRRYGHRQSYTKLRIDAILTGGEQRSEAEQSATHADNDDLTRIEGIGPKIQELLNDDGIHSFAELAVASVEHISEILSAGGSRFGTAVPNTWPEQAQLAADGKWDELQQLQDELDHGKREDSA